MNIHSEINLISPISLRLAVALAALALLAAVLLRWVGGSPLGLARRWGLVVLRAVVVLTLLAILFNPVRVDESPGSIQQPEVFYMLDASRSMALGESVSRWEEAVRTIQEVERLLPGETAVHISTFRFGSRLAAVDAPFWRAPEPERVRVGGPGLALAASPPAPAPRGTVSPTDIDTQVGTALRQLTDRFGRSAPRAVVLFSDGQARDADDVEQIASRYARMKIPIHVVPAGNVDRTGDVAVISMVAPARVRKHSQVSVQVFVRSYGYDGKRAELKLIGLGDDGRPKRELNRLPIGLKDGVQSFNLVFESDLDTRRIQAAITPQADEVSTDNNTFSAEVAVDRTKIRVLYVEGSATRLAQVRQAQGSEPHSEYSDLRDALTQDPDIECVVVLPVGSGLTQLQRVNDWSGRGLPVTAAELFAFDAIVLSDVPSSTIGDKELGWIEEWIGQRGGGLCMGGGPRSFAAGGWRGQVMERMLPVELAERTPDWLVTTVPVKAAAGVSLHPIWHIVADEKQNRLVLDALPAFGGLTQFTAKPNATVLATAQIGPSADDVPVVAVQSYGRGRTMAVATGISDRWAADFAHRWGEGDNRYYAKFWRNAIYWLTENSSIGRRRLIADTDKRLYRPGETIAIGGEAFDESSKRTLDYRLSVMIEPLAGGDPAATHSPVRWPDELDRSSGEQGPLIAWGEEFEMPQDREKKGYAIRLPIAESTDASGASVQSMRIELTAYEDNTQVDSTSLDIQVLDDPFEQQNPMPNHELLERVASLSGGKVLRDARALAETISELPIKVGPPVVRKVPLWSQWWLLGFLVFLLTVEWIWRRSLGLA